MRLKNIYKTLKEIQPIVENIKAEKVNGNSTDSVIKNWPSVLDVIGKIKNIEVFKDVGQDLFSISPAFAEHLETIRLTSALSNRFNIWLNNLKSKINIIIELCESIGYEENEGSFEVKLPETNDLQEFATYVNDFSRVIQLCPFIKTNETDIKLTKTDIGSTWLEFAVKGSEIIMVLTALGYFVQAALKIRSMYLTCELQKEAVRGAQMKNDLAEDITNLYKDIIKATAVNEIKNIEEVLNKPLQPEERNSAEKSLDILGKLMSKGLEVYATLDSPQEAKDIFPSIDQQRLFPDTIKLLTNNSDEK